MIGVVAGVNKRLFPLSSYIIIFGVACFVTLKLILPPLFMADGEYEPKQKYILPRSPVNNNSVHFKPLFLYKYQVFLLFAAKTLLYAYYLFPGAIVTGKQIGRAHV